MSVVIDGTSGITSPAETVQGALTTTGNTILGDSSADTLNVGNGGLVKDASGNVGIGTASPQSLLDLTGNDPTLRFTDNAGSPTATWSLRSNDANFSVRSVTAGADRLVIDSTGASTFTGTGKFATTIGVGNATPAASGSGITFPATQSASSDANTLDDYEEGTWTVVWTSLTGTPSNLTGNYVKIGRQVSWQYHTIGGTLSGTGNVVRFTLPFAIAAGFSVAGSWVRTDMSSAGQTLMYDGNPGTCYPTTLSSSSVPISFGGTFITSA